MKLIVVFYFLWVTHICLFSSSLSRDPDVIQIVVVILRLQSYAKCFFMPTLLFYVFIPSGALFFSMVYSALFCPLLVDSNYAGLFCGSCTQSVRVYLPVVCMAVAAACQLVPTKGNLPLTIMYHGYHCCLLAILKRVL
jgi:hypothetical protein